MSSASRVTLPENFYDIQSDRLLCQPEPQYLLAKLYLDAIGAALPMPSGIGLDGRQVPTAGAAYADADRDRLMISKGLPSDLFALGVDFAKQKGGTVRINRPLFADTTYTVASRRLTNGQTISTKAQNFGQEQTNLTLERFAGPYDPNGISAGVGCVAPIGIEAFDANMGQFSTTSIAGAQLKRDFHKFLDAVHVEICNVGAVIYPDGMTADNDAGQVSAYPMTLEQISRTEQLMDEASLPTFGDGCRLMLLTPAQWKQLKHDPEYEAQASFHKEFNLLYGGYVGTVGKFHIFKCTTLQKPLNGSSVPVQRGVALAPGFFMGGMGRAPHIASSTDDNFGETGKVVWIADLAFGITDARFCYSVRSA